VCIYAVWRYPVDFAVHYNIHYITFTILVRETWNDYPDLHILRNYICAMCKSDVSDMSETYLHGLKG
jgi:hypothetical protein